MLFRSGLADSFHKSPFDVALEDSLRDFHFAAVAAALKVGVPAERSRPIPFSAMAHLSQQLSGGHMQVFAHDEQASIIHNL